VATVDKEFRVKSPVVSEGSVTATSIIRAGGTPTQFLMADGSVSTSSGGIKSTYSATPPTNPTPVAGDIWIDTSDGTQYTYINDGDSSQWVELSGTGSGGGGSASDSDQNILAQRIFG